MLARFPLLFLILLCTVLSNARIVVPTESAKCLGGGTSLLYHRYEVDPSDKVPTTWPAGKLYSDGENSGNLVWRYGVCTVSAPCGAVLCVPCHARLRSFFRGRDEGGGSAALARGWWHGSRTSC